MFDKEFQQDKFCFLKGGKKVRVSTFATAGLEFSWSLCAGPVTECAALCSRTGRGIKHNQKQPNFFIVGFSVSVNDKLRSEGRRTQPKPTTKFHLLCGFMVAWTGHIGYVCRYGLNLPHELIPNPGIVLEQCHLNIKKWFFADCSYWLSFTLNMSEDIKERILKGLRKQKIPHACRKQSLL